jgi:ATP phosphoribosyltransferase regulatory subunit
MSVALKKKKKKEDISKKILSSFKKKGFNFIDLDMVIDTDLLTRRSGEAFKKYALNFKDNSGKEISLRPAFELIAPTNKNKIKYFFI